MGAAYIEKFDGYIADTPNLDFERCDGKVFSYYEVNSSNFSDTLNFLTITGGQGTSPQAYIPSDRTTEFSFESSQFSIDMFAMANAVEKMDSGDFGTRETERYDVKIEGDDPKDTTKDGTITLPFEVQAGSVRIRGLEEAVKIGETEPTVSAGKFTVTITQYAKKTGDQTKDTDAQTVIKLKAGDFTPGQAVRVSYVRRVVNGTQIVVKTTSSTAKGELWAHYPVYSSGVDCTDASIKGWVHMYFPRVRVTALPGFDASYKSAQTNGVTFAAIDSKLSSHKYYDITYEPTSDLNGDIVTITDAQSVTWR